MIRATLAAILAIIIVAICVQGCGDSPIQKTPPAVPTPLAIDTFSPEQGPISGGTQLRITGTGLDGADIFLGPHKLTATIDPNGRVATADTPQVPAPIMYNVSATKGTESVAAGNQFSYAALGVPPPQFLLSNPDKGTMDGGTVVQIAGNFFYTGTGETRVFFGGTQASAVANVTSTTLEATTAAVTTTGLVNIEILTPSGSVIVPNAYEYTASLITPPTPTRSGHVALVCSATVSSISPTTSRVSVSFTAAPAAPPGAANAVTVVEILNPATGTKTNVFALPSAAYVGSFGDDKVDGTRTTTFTMPPNATTGVRITVVAKLSDTTTEILQNLEFSVTTAGTYTFFVYYP